MMLHRHFEEMRLDDESERAEKQEAQKAIEAEGPVTGTADKPKRGRPRKETTLFDE